MQLTEVSIVGIRTSVTVFRRHAGGLKFVVIPVIHIGRPDYYRAVAERLRPCHAVVAEQYDGPSSTGLAYVTALRLARQRIGRDLVHQDIDYASLGVPVIFPDGDLGLDVGPDRRMPAAGWADVALFTPALALDMALDGPEWLAGRHLDIDDDSEPEFRSRFLHPQDPRRAGRVAAGCAAGDSRRVSRTRTSRSRSSMERRTCRPSSEN